MTKLAVEIDSMEIGTPFTCILRLAGLCIYRAEVVMLRMIGIGHLLVYILPNKIRYLWHRIYTLSATEIMLQAIGTTYRFCRAGQL